MPCQIKNPARGEECCVEASRQHTSRDYRRTAILIVKIMVRSLVIISKVCVGRGMGAGRPGGAEEEESEEVDGQRGTRERTA